MNLKQIWKKPKKQVAKKIPKKVKKCLKSKLDEACARFKEISEETLSVISQEKEVKNDRQDEQRKTSSARS